jgi:DNA polymerase-1
MGDASDNIPGIPGIGEKTAIKLLKEYDTVENLVANVENLKGATKKKIEEHAKLGLLSKEIATIICDAPITVSVDQTVYEGVKTDQLGEFFQARGMKTMMSKINYKASAKNETKFKVIKHTTLDMFAEANALNVEVYDENYNKSFVIGLSISNKTGNYYMDFADVKEDKLLLA